MHSFMQMSTFLFVQSRLCLLFISFFSYLIQCLKIILHGYPLSVIASFLWQFFTKHILLLHFLYCRQIVLEALQQLVKLTHPELTNGKDETPENCGKDKKEQDHVNGVAITENKNDVHKNNETEKVKLNRIHATSSDSSTNDSISIHSDGKSKDSDSYLTPHPILETHNYAKIPLIPTLDANCGSLQKTTVTDCR